MEFKVWFDEDGMEEAHAVNITASNKDAAVDAAEKHLNRVATQLDMPYVNLEFNYIQTPEGDFKRVGSEWYRVHLDWEDPDPGDADPGNHPDADRPPGTSGSWGEA